MEKSKETVTENKVVLTLDDVRKLIKAPEDAVIYWHGEASDDTSVTISIVWTSKPKPRKARDPE